MKNNDELKQQVRESVENFIQTVSDEMDSIPKNPIAVGDRKNRDAKFVNHPSKILHRYSPRQEEFFIETAEWINNTENGFEIERYKSSPKITIVDRFGERVHKSTEEPILSTYCNALFNFAGTVMDYSGDYAISDEGFDVAYREHWLPKYESGLKTFEILIPFHYFTVTGKNNPKIQLSSKFKLRQRRHNYYRIESLCISPLTEPERRGMQTALANGGTKFDQFFVNTCSYKICAKVAAREPEATQYDLGKEVATRVATALRLFNLDPEEGDLTIGATFRKEPSWLEFRENIPYFRIVGDRLKDRTQQQASYFLYPDTIENFSKFWKQYNSQIRIDKDGQFSRSIQRFNEIRSKRFYEDQLLDCLIGLEGLLLRGVGSNSSKTLRLKLRGGQILDDKMPYERDKIQSFLQDIYSVRGGIVHENKYLNELLEENDQLKLLDDEFDHPEDVVGESRRFMGATIVCYMHLTKKKDLSIDEIGEKLDETALNATSSELLD